MKALAKGVYEDPNKGTWVLHIVEVGEQGIAAAFSDGTIKVFPREHRSGQPLAPLKSWQAHSGPIDCMRGVSGSKLLVSCSEDKIRLWDLEQPGTEPVREFTAAEPAKYLSLAVGHQMLAGGTELQGVDAKVHIWDLESGKWIRSFVDSHHDDVTDLTFHPTEKNLVMSGSTDGYVNVYDLTVEDEEDALFQVINFASIHSAKFVSPFRIATLSHMETFAVHELEKDVSEELTEPTPAHEFGDVRGAWDCEYVVDVLPGYVACGANSKGQLALYRFDARAEAVDTADAVMLLGAHGEEVVRAVYFDGARGLVYTGGEDGCFKIWETAARWDTPAEFFGAVQGEDVEMAVDAEAESEDAADKKHKRHKKHKKHKDKKEKEHKKHKKDKEHKKHKKHKDVRFKPY